MYFKYFFISGTVGAILIFIIQAINFFKESSHSRWINEW